MTEAIEKHYYGAHNDAGRVEMAQRAADLGWISWVHFHSFKDSCNGLCRKVRPTP
jgi:hypothetical protein